MNLVVVESAWGTVPLRAIAELGKTTFSLFMLFVGGFGVWLKYSLWGCLVLGGAKCEKVPYRPIGLKMSKEMWLRERRVSAKHD